MRLQKSLNRANRRTGIFNEYLKTPQKYLQKYARSIMYFLRGDVKLLISSKRTLGPVAFLTGSLTFCVAVIKAVWTDDPIKTFDNPPYFSTFSSILSIIPLPAFAATALFFIFVNIPMYIVSSVLGYRPRIDRIVTASIYTISISLVYITLVAALKSFMLEAFVRDDLSNKNLINNLSFVLVLPILFTAARSIKYLGISHGMSGYRFFFYNICATGIPLMLIEAFVPPESAIHKVADVFEPRPIQMFNIPSGGMMPALAIGSDVIMNRLITIDQIKPGDIIVFNLKRQENVPYVKRLIGMSGDRIQMIKGRLYINNAQVKRERIGDYSTSNAFGEVESVPRYIETLPNGAQYQIIERDADKGFWDDTEVYNVPAGKMFFLGDNRDNSTDSRDLQSVGFISYRDVIGKMYFSTFPRRQGYLYKDPKTLP